MYDSLKLGRTNSSLEQGENITIFISDQASLFAMPWIFVVCKWHKTFGISNVVEQNNINFQIEKDVQPKLMLYSCIIYNSHASKNAAAAV